MFSCLHIPDFAVQSLIRSEPELSGRAVAVLAGRPPLEKVIALNESARQIGVEIGATKAQLEAWEDLVLRERSESQENSAHAALLDCAQSFSPEVEDTEPGTVLLNLAGLEPLLGPVSKIAQDLARRALPMDLQANVAVAANPDAALLAARGFSGVTLIPEGREAERFGALPVDVLLESFSSDASEVARWLETFDRWGIRNLRALAGLPEIPLTERLGQQGLRLQKLARGEVMRDLRVYESLPVFEERIELEYPIVLLEPLAFLLNRMLEQICARLGTRARAAQELRLELELAKSAEDCDPAHATTFTRTLRLPVPMLDTKVLLKLLQLELQAHPPGAPILKIHLVAEPARPRTTQSGLFLPAFPEPEKLELTLARISGIVGEGRAGSPELLDTHREGAFAIRPFVPTQEEEKSAKRNVTVQVEDDNNGRLQIRKSDSKGAFEVDVGEPQGLKPSFLLAHSGTAKAMPFPNPIYQPDSAEGCAEEKMTAVIALRLFRPRLRAVVNVCEGKPVKLKCIVQKDISGEIVWTAGPWRSSGDWSEQEGWSREEWDIAVLLENQIILYRLVENRLTRQWWVEGVYD